MEGLPQISEDDNEIPLLYSLIRQNPNFLHDCNKQQFADTPLHAATTQGQMLLALEIQRLMPSLGSKLNPDGFTPIDLALQHGHVHIATALINVDPLLVGVQGREGITPLHWAAEHGRVDSLAEFLLRCPNSIEALTIRGESAVHVAVKNGNLGAFRVLLGWLKRTGRTQMLRWRDWEGNTVSHLAAYTNQSKVMELLDREGLVNDKNFKGLTAMDIAMKLSRNEDNRKAKQIHDIPTIANYLSSPISLNEKMFKLFTYLDMGMPSQWRNSILVVAVLIATATFQAALNPPDGFTDGSNGKTTLQRLLIVIFALFNSIALATSLVMIVVLVPTHWSNVLLYLSLFSLTTSCTVATLVLFPDRWPVTGSFAVYYMVAFISLVKIRISQKRKGWVCNPVVDNNCFYSTYEVLMRVYHNAKVRKSNSLIPNT